MTHIQCFAICCSICLAAWAVCQSIWDFHDEIKRLAWAHEEWEADEDDDEDYDDEWGM